MAHAKRFAHGRKRKFNTRNTHQPKPKKSKFNLKNASYVKERDAKNKEIEAHRQMIEEKKAQEQLETDSSEEELDPEQRLMASFKKFPTLTTVVVSNSESEHSDETSDKSETSDNEEGATDKKENTETSGIDKQQSSDSNPDEKTVFNITEDDKEYAETVEEDEGNVKDPFAVHLHNDLDKDLLEAVSAKPPITEVTEMSWPILGHVTFTIPKPIISEVKNVDQPILSMLEKKEYTKCGKIPSVIETVDWNKLYIKSQIQNNLRKANYNNIKENVKQDLTPLQKELFSMINNYQDLCYPDRTYHNAEEIRFVYCLHTINHLLKTRAKILHHSAKLAKSGRTGIAEVPDGYKDQGFVRPKVLILVPFRHSCLKIVELLIAILIGEDKGGLVINKLRFMEEFTGGELAMSTKNPKPEDYQQTFQGNIDDKFKIGIALTKKGLKLYSDFYSSDIIIASILDLRMLIGAKGELNRDYDFLASIELLIMDQAELFTMQNWLHLLHVTDHLHLQLKDSHDTDYSRLRSWCANGWTKYYRQTLIFSSIPMPELNLIHTECSNYAGGMLVLNPVEFGSICDVVVDFPQEFWKFEAANYGQSFDKRMEFFVTKFLPHYKNTHLNHTLIYVPSYYDFVQLRNYMRKEEVNFVQICEYSSNAKIARARDMFFHNGAHFLLYSGRFHFFRRLTIKGIRHIIFFSPPLFPQLYSEMCNMMQKQYLNPKSGSMINMTITTLYCEIDTSMMARIVGTKEISKMLQSKKNVHMFKSG